MVAQLGRRKPILKRALGEADGDDMRDSECPEPEWQRLPARVTFEPLENRKLTFSVRDTLGLFNDYRVVYGDHS